MSTHGEQIWQQGSAREIMRSSRQAFDAAGEDGWKPASAYVMRASDHWSLVKRYTKGWRRIVGAWHVRQAVVRAKQARDVGITDFDQIDVVARILARAPWWLGGNVAMAKRLLVDALSYSAPNEMGEMQPHTRALMLCTLARVLAEEGHTTSAAAYYQDALGLKEEILAEGDLLMAQRQWVRVAADAGFFLLDQATANGVFLLRLHYLDVLEETEILAYEVSKDQYKKINTGLCERGYSGGT